MCQVDVTSNVRVEVRGSVTVRVNYESGGEFCTLSYIV